MSGEQPPQKGPPEPFSPNLARRSMKVPIPRLRRASKDSGGPDAGGAGDGKHRVSHACEPCRQRKTKCSGESPVCKHCQDFKITCYYADGKRDRAKSEMAGLKAKVELYEQLLNQLKSQVDSAGQLAITKALQGAQFNPLDENSATLAQNRDGESLVSADVGSTGSMDHIREEVNADHTPYPMGYMGKSSEVVWIQRVAQQLAKEACSDSPPLPGEGIFARTSTPANGSCPSTKHNTPDGLVDDEFQFQTPAYHLDDLSVSLAGGIVDPFLLPDKRIADRLISTFFTTVHPTFPIVLEKLFMSQYDTFFETFSPPGYSRRWLAMLNLIFAVGALYGKLVHAPWCDDDTEHMKYFARARMLSLDEGCMLEAADMQQVQLVGLTGMFLVACNQTNRAWNVIGLAIRYAQTLGLNLRNDVPGLSEVEREMRARIWYALYSSEHLLCLMTGRPSAIRDQDISVPLPRPVHEIAPLGESFESTLLQFRRETPSTPSASDVHINPSQIPVTSWAPGSNPTRASPQILTPTSGPESSKQSSSREASQAPQAATTANSTGPLASPATYFLEHVKLSRITCTVLSGLYSPDTVNRTWSDVQGIISQLELSVAQWKSNLPGFLDFSNKQATQQYIRNLDNRATELPQSHNEMRYRTSLAFQYHHARILINRPCLCRLDFRIPNESDRSRGFNRSAATTCVGAARETIAMLPDEPNPSALIAIAPWWCLLHYIVAAAVILMVEISMRAEHNPHLAEGLLNDTKKVVRWLRVMAKDNIAAERSWAVLSKLLIVCAPRVGGDTSDVERDLDLNDDHVRREPMSDSVMPTHDNIRPSHPAAHALTMSSGLIPSDMTYLFRGQFDESFPFTGLSAQTPVGPMIGGIPGATPIMSTHHTHTESFHEIVYSPTQVVQPQVGPSVTGPSSQELSISQRSVERRQKRFSLGVSNISLPSPPTFPQWSSPDTESAEFAAQAAGRGRADLEAAVAAVGHDGGPSDKKGGRKRSSISEDH